MPKKEFYFTAVSQTVYIHEEGTQSSAVKHNNLRLEISKGLNRSEYFDGKGLPRKAALKPLTASLILGIITNIRTGADKGWWKEGEHMEYVIEQLQRAFVAVGENPVPGIMHEDDDVEFDGPDMGGMDTDGGYRG